jgi:hypothetical protein
MFKVIQEAFSFHLHDAEKQPIMLMIIIILKKTMEMLKPLESSFSYFFTSSVFAT